jgi:hypothetical protein
MVDYLPSTVESLRATILNQGLLDQAELADALADCRHHLLQPDTAFTMYTVAQVGAERFDESALRRRETADVDLSALDGEMAGAFVHSR